MISVYLSRVEWVRFLDEGKKLLNVLFCFKLCWYTSMWKIIKTIACADSVNVNIALNLQSYKEN